MTAYVAIGDVHGNARALRAALDQARRGPMDRLVLLGDLLTYGHDVDEVIALVSEAQQRDGATLLIGNHDRLYFDLDDGESGYYDKLPAWIRETVDVTRARLDARRLRELEWSEEMCGDGVLFAHANPFPHGDWTYLNTPEEHARAAEALAARGLAAGVFGHTHRPKIFSAPGVPSEPALDADTPLGAGPTVLNAGAIGQPRNKTKESVILRLHVDGSARRARFERFTYDVAAHLKDLAACGASPETVARLRGFF